MRFVKIRDPKQILKQDIISSLSLDLAKSCGLILCVVDSLHYLKNKPVPANSEQINPSMNESMSHAMGMRNQQPWSKIPTEFPEQAEESLDHDQAQGKRPTKHKRQNSIQEYLNQGQTLSMKKEKIKANLLRNINAKRQIMDKGLDQPQD
ncbi:hypothetical protein H4219_004000 [Mycoemilia scoparia]|uniref:Uncharacterized protein n=1 Tax=Mycoemilia scoparia TaxID=417184 RepID=A0A9W8A173_9FUNG|nr:hypothetical protein H4219_004000 [Mycoemilia scoparia]